MSKKIYKETYFQHDRYARQDPKIKSLLVHFRKISEEKAQAACCIFWWIVEDMHTDDYPISKLDVFADDYRCDVEFLKSILEDFDLFRIEGDCYVSDRVLKNLREQEEKSEKARKSIEKRWKNKGHKPQEEPKEEPLVIDEELVNSIIQIFNKEFKKTQIVGKETREKIYKLTQRNKINLDIWKKVFSNAKRGWDIKGEHKKPSLKNILDNWDAFASDDYFLTPDIEAEKKQKELEKQREKEAEKIIHDQHFQLNNDLLMYDDYRTLTYFNQLKAIEFYKSHNNSITETIAYIKRGFN